jgi:hypothetical protein
MTIQQFPQIQLVLWRVDRNSGATNSNQPSFANLRFQQLRRLLKRIENGRQSKLVKVMPSEYLHET